MRQLAVLLLAPALFAQPRLQNARMETRAVSGTLDATFRSIVNGQNGAVWIGYAAPQIAGDRTMCCFNSIDGVQYQGCMLEPRDASTTMQAAAPAGTIQLEGATEFFVFFRVENKQVAKVRTFSTECNIDAGGLPFVWLTGVNPAQSVGLLESLVPSSDARADRKLANGAISAIAMHRDPAADAALDRLAAATQPEETRRQAAFWMGNARGRHGFESLQRILRDDPSDRVREHAVFALTQSKEAEAIPMVARIAHDDKSTKVRSQALFWLAQRAGKQISEAAIRQAIDNEPETQVKKKAVFALTQMKNGDGVPLLIEIARTNRNAVVRKEAMFWLGQSKDARATQFFEELLVKR
jgi:hypothetical protein